MKRQNGATATIAKGAETPVTNGRRIVAQETAQANPGASTEPRYKLLERRKVEIEDPTLSSIGTLYMTVEGVTPLIVHRFGDKAMKMMLRKQQGLAVGKPGPKDPEADALDCLYFIGDRPKKWEDVKKGRLGVPALWFKCAMLRGAKMNDEFMSDAKTAFWVESDDGTLVNLRACAPIIRMDPVRQQQTADIRCRPEFATWEASLTLRYAARQVTYHKLYAWLSSAGLFNGVGDWRCNGRSSTGTHGAFRVKKDSIEVVEPVLER